MAAEILRMREQLELLQSELLCIRAGGGPFEETHVNIVSAQVIYV